ncbi:MAG: deoxyguanosinetriphosphate triphosphohydrolase [Neisseriaceae bacterium]|nr:MAG: deoxyguanosinetriphosphate triphosphohydrolase [Neisseriaceae bacterium]
MKWTQLLSTQRFKISNGKVVKVYTDSSREAVNNSRSGFLIDYDRVVFSGSFRRLGRKTQVHPFSESDYTHNRLTHSVEVASVGRSIGNQLGLMLMIENELPDSIKPMDIGSIVQVACLAHDMGNPPFGHIGEEALRAWFRSSDNARYLLGMSQQEINDLQTYEGNAHTVRIVTSLEMYKSSGGMRLTAASIGSLIKYPWTSSAPQGRTKFNIYQTELHLMHHVFKELGIEQISDNTWLRHPLSYLMEASDDICYAILDLEDAVEIGVLTEKDVEKILKPILHKENITRDRKLTSMQYCRMLRGKAIGCAIDNVAHTFFKYRQEIMQGDFQAKDLLSVCRSEVSEAIKNAKQLARDKIFMHPNKLMTEIAGFPCLGSILSLLIPATYEYVKLQNKQEINSQHRLALKLLKEDPILETDSLYTAYMKVLDFVGGLTDNAAAKMAREVSGIGMIK